MFHRRIGLGLALALALCGGRASAASHSDAPLIKQDPQANITDVYTFLGPKYDNAAIKVLNVIVHVRPFSEPGDGVMYDRFADDALYSIHIANPATGAGLIRYDFRFSPVSSAAGSYKNRDTILSYGRGTAIGGILDVGDARHNFVQTYSVTKVTSTSSATIATARMTPPPNVGARTTPFYNDATTGKAISGATTFAGLDKYTRQTVFSLASGEATFAGPREDGFFADTPGIFDLLDSRILGSSLGQEGNGVDDFKGFNVLAFALQIPVSQLPLLDYTLPGIIGGAQKGVGVYASVSRPRTTLRSTTGDPQSAGPFVQVNRMGNPLFNEVLVAIKDKDKYNRTLPTDDATQFKTYAAAPEVIVLLNTVFGTSFVTTGRADLCAVYIPDVIRVNTETEAVRIAGKAGFHRLSLLGGDVTATGKPSGWPNGRRLGDDVVDIALSVIASGPTFSTVTLVGDNVPANDQVYNCVFPYSATPHAGPRHKKDSGVNAGP